MIFFYNAQGNVINVVPEPVYQGSNKANTIYVVAPFSSNVQVLAHFLLPNGEILQPAYAPNKNGLTLLDTLNINDSIVGVWGVQLAKVMTAYAGTVSVQFEFISCDQEITTQTVTFPVSKGVPPPEPIDLTTETTLQEILSYISIISETLDTVGREVPLVSNETFLLDVTHKSIVVGYNASLSLSSFNKTPVQGDRFWSVCKTSDNFAYSFVATVTSVNNENSVVEVKFTKVVLLYDADFYINVTNKLNKLIFDGNGDKFLSDDGKYKEIVGGGTTVTVNGEEVETFDADTKLNKITTQGTFRAYCVSASGTQTTRPVNSNNYPTQIVQYSSTKTGGTTDFGGEGGCITCSDPVNPYHTANKKYVDEKTALYQHEVQIYYYYYNEEAQEFQLVEDMILCVLTRSNELLTIENFYSRLNGINVFGLWNGITCNYTVTSNHLTAYLDPIAGSMYYEYDITENNETGYYTLSDIVTEL